MTYYWGVDSFNPAQREQRWYGGRRMTLFDFLASRVRAPDFWGRYLNQARASRLTDEEIRYLAGRTNPQGAGVRLLLVYNDIRAADCELAGAAGYDRGAHQAGHAAALARGLGAGAGVRLYADLENWRASTDWLRGWWDAMAGTEFAGIGGLYGRGVERLNMRGAGRLRVRDVHPDHARGPEPYAPGIRSRYLRSGWSANVPAAIEEEFEPWVIRPLLSRSPPPGLPAVRVWTNMPRQTRREPPPIPTEFRGIGPLGAETVVWQYCYGCFKRETDEHALFDLNLAKQAAYAEMWQP